MTQPAALLQPLRGVRVLDLSRYLPGPYLTRILADFGANIIKVESPQGDPARYMAPQIEDCAALFTAINAGKRSIVVDLKKPEGKHIVTALASRCDIVVESFRPGVADRLGVGYEALRSVNPKIIMCSISGYGQTGPLASVPGHDINYIARSGILDLLKSPSGVPTIPGVQIADVAGGALTAATGVLAALLEREQTGAGRFLDISMTRSAISLAATSSSEVGLGTHVPPSQGFLTGGVPCYRVYETKDGRFMALGALEPKFFATFCEVTGVPHLTDKMYATGESGKNTTLELEELFLTKTQEQWVQALNGHGVCCEPVRTVAEAVVDADLNLSQTRVNGICSVLPHFGIAPSSSEIGDSPNLGEHGAEILEELEINRDLVASAASTGAVLLNK